MWCRFSLDWNIAMTKNKKRKAILRTIAESEGVGIARAGMLHDRDRQPVDESVDKALQVILNIERHLGWFLKTTDGHEIKVHFDSDSIESLVTSKDDFLRSKGIPHYVVNKGAQAQRSRFLHGIRAQVNASPGASGYVLSRQTMGIHLKSLTNLHAMRLDSINEAGADNFAHYRKLSIRNNGTHMLGVAQDYAYVFIYDWDELMTYASDDIKDMVHFLLEHGKKTGIHFIISTAADDKYVKAWDERKLVRFITIRNPREGQEESAVTKIKDLWTGIKIPNW